MNDDINLYLMNETERLIEGILEKQSNEFNDKYFDFLFLLVRLTDNLINFDRFERMYKNLFIGLNKTEIYLFDKITKMYMQNMIEIKDNNKKLTLEKKGNDIYE